MTLQLCDQPPESLLARYATVPRSRFWTARAAYFSAAARRGLRHLLDAHNSILVDLSRLPSRQARLVNTSVLMDASSQHLELALII